MVSWHREGETLAPRCDPWLSPCSDFTFSIASLKDHQQQQRDVSVYFPIDVLRLWQHGSASSRTHAVRPWRCAPARVRGYGSCHRDQAKNANQAADLMAGWATKKNILHKSPPYSFCIYTPIRCRSRRGCVKTINIQGTEEFESHSLKEPTHSHHSDREIEREGESDKNRERAR